MLRTAGTARTAKTGKDVEDRDGTSGALARRAAYGPGEEVRARVAGAAEAGGLGRAADGPPRRDDGLEARAGTVKSTGGPARTRSTRS